MSFLLKPILSEKTCFLAKKQNTLSFLIPSKITKNQLKNYIVNTLKIEILKISTMAYTKKNLKKVYIVCKQKYPIHKIWEV